MIACPARRPHHIPTRKKEKYPMVYLCQIRKCGNLIFVAYILFLKAMSRMIIRVQIPKIPSRRDAFMWIKIYHPTIDHMRPNSAHTPPIFLSTFPALAKLYRPESSVPSAQTFAVAIAWFGVIPNSVRSGMEIRALPPPALPIILPNKPIKKIKIYTPIKYNLKNERVIHKISAGQHHSILFFNTSRRLNCL